MPQNLGPQMNQIIGNRIATELNQKPRFQPKSFNRRLNSEFGGSRSSTKMHEATIHDYHQQIQA
jgi:transposase-like protein